MIMNKMRFLTIGLLATIFSVVYSQQDGRDMRIVADYVKRLAGVWEFRDTLLTDSGTWYLHSELTLLKDSVCSYYSGRTFVITDGSKHSSWASAGFMGDKWDVGNWKYSSAYNIIYLYSSFGEIESWRIVKLEKDTLTTIPAGKYLIEMQEWPYGQRKEITWTKIK